MKLTLLLVLCIFSVTYAYSQTILENPKIGMSTSSNVKIERIEMRDTATVLWFHVNQTPGAWISVPDKSFIQPVGSTEKLFIVAAEGIKVNEQFIMPISGETNYKLFFPKIDPSVNKLDFGEGNDGGSWFIYDIQLKPELFKSMVPEQITGNWFRSDNAQWEISLLDSVAVYKSQVWKYGKYSEKNGLGKIGLKKGSKTLTIYTKTMNDSLCLIGETPDRMVKYAHQPDESVIPEDKEYYKLPIFKMDTVTYCGYIKGFSPRFPQHTGMVYVNEVLTDEQASYLLKIADDGTFKVKFAHCNPQGILVRLPFSNEAVYVEPGKTTFQLIDAGNSTNPYLFMGDCARVNNDLVKVKHIYSFDYNQMMDNVGNSTPEQYKNWLEELQQKDLQTLKNFALTHTISSKALQIKEMEINYRFSKEIMSYNMNAQSAGRKNNNIPPDQRKISFQPDQPDSSYYSFLTDELVNNQLAVISPDYFFFINRLKYMKILTMGAMQTLTTADILREMCNLGYQLTDNEKELLEKLKEIESPEIMKLNKEFSEKYGDQGKAFSKKYLDTLKEFVNANKEKYISMGMREEYLLSKNITFTDSENEFIKASKQFEENPLIKKSQAISTEISKKISKFHNERNGISSEIFQNSRTKVTRENMQKVLGIPVGFASDVIASQDYTRPIVSEMTPVSDEKLTFYQKSISSPFIASYIALKNNETKTKIEANKKQTDSNLNQVPKSERDKVFDAIMEKYKGKVVYVDFWATWCGPCRSGIERIKPLKEEMADENVAFVYISGPSSPKATYDNMIPTIRGEHYRVSDDEWNTLCGMFKISGIPHYVLVGKDGKVINPQLGHLENSSLKTMLLKYIQE